MERNTVIAMEQTSFSREYYRRSQEVLNTALDSAPAYHAWRRFDPGRDVAVDDRYAALPLLDKEDIRSHFPQGLVPGSRSVSEGLAFGEIEYVQTSGTTSEKVTNLWNQSWWNASEAASWRLNSHTSHLDHVHREAQLASALSVGFLSKDDLPMQDRILNDRFLFLNEKATALEWTDIHYRRMASELNEFRPAILEANPSLLARLCWWALDNHVAIHPPQVIVITYEFFSRLHLKAIRRVFPAPVISSYGSTESGYIFMQCEHGTFHQNTEFCRVDFLPLKEIHGGPALGRIAVTTFGNPWMSLIRFDVGDLVRLKPDAACPCGRNEGFMAAAIEGRTCNITLSGTGRLVTTGQVDGVLSGIDGLRDYQLIQQSAANYLLRVSAKEESRSVADGCRRALRLLYGPDSGIEIEFCDNLAPTPSGKYRRTYAEFDTEIQDFSA
jgi:phenylacetate-coenzyme A ligase PaaK-like adenylate-forming protein